MIDGTAGATALVGVCSGECLRLDVSRNDVAGRAAVMTGSGWLSCRSMSYDLPANVTSSTCENAFLQRVALGDWNLTTVARMLVTVGVAVAPDAVQVLRAGCRACLPASGGGPRPPGLADRSVARPASTRTGTLRREALLICWPTLLVCPCGRSPRILPSRSGCRWQLSASTSRSSARWGEPLRQAPCLLAATECSGLPPYVIPYYSMMMT